MKSASRWTVVLIVLIVVVGGASAWYVLGRPAEVFRFRTAPVYRGDLTATISATGTIEPQEVIDVGAQVAGRVLSFGVDEDGKTVDYGSHVKQGEILAQIDPSLYTADKTSAMAQLQQSQAGVEVAKAGLEQGNARLAQAQADWDRAQKLGPSSALSSTQYDAYKAAYQGALADVKLAQASILQAQAAVAQSQASVDRAQQNLDYCTITSPVDGVIIDRRVNIGQTVVSSLNAPSLFLIAKDLTHMQIWVSVNEADISRIQPGQKVTYTVDAFAGQTFQGQVGKVRLNASMTQNVVTYTVEVNTDNDDGKLLPYLTANATFQTERQENVLIVPNVALRWTPSSSGQIAPVSDSSAAGAGRSAARPADAGEDNSHTGTVWVLDGNLARPIRVQLGVSDGSHTQVAAPQLQEGMKVITGELRADQVDDSEDTRNPFLPQFGNRRNAGTAQHGGGGH